MTTPIKSRENIDTISFQAFGQFKIGENGELSDASLIKTGEALGHGVSIDMKSLESAFSLVGGKSIKAYNGHSWAPKGSDITGMFSGIYIDAVEGKLRAKNFQWLKSFQKHRAGEYETLKELAAEHSDQFGISLTHSFDLVWVFESGDEVDAMRDWVYDNDAPEGALNEMPAVRFKRIISADFVGEPAANEDGLFSAKPKSEQQEKPNDNVFEMKLLKDIQSAYSADKDLLAEAIQFAAQKEGADFTQIETHIAEFKTKLEIESYSAKVEDLKSQLSAKEDKIAELENKISVLSGGQGEFSEGSSPEPEEEEKKADVVIAEYKAMDAGPERAKFRADNAWAWAE